ncbi:MAG: lamin tail domain-containing protein [Verrucomicrobiota bacterium]
MKTERSPYFSLGTVASLLALTALSAFAANLTPISVTGFNVDVVVENTSAGPPYTTAVELNPGEGEAFYQKGLPGTSSGLPVSGSFTSALDGTTVFQFQSYTAKNALVLSSDTGVSSGVLTLTTPAIYGSIAVIANSANAGSDNTGTLTFTFNDGSIFVTNYYAPDWFGNSGYALWGVERISLTLGTTQGAPDDPRFYQTTINLAGALGAANKPLVSLTFGEPSGVNATGIYAVSGALVSGLPATITSEPVNVTVNQLSPAGFSAVVAGNPPPTLQWYQNGAPIPGATNSSYDIASASLTNNGSLFKLVAANLISNLNHSVTSTVVTLTVNPINLPIAVNGYNLDLVVESNAVGPPYNNYAKELNPGEGNAFYQSGLPGYSYGLPTSGAFFSAVDGSLFQFQPYTMNNALVLSSATGIGSGTLTLVTPQTYQSIAVIANSADGDATGPASVTLIFDDGTTFTTTYNAPDWFNNTLNVALQGVERISLSDGTTSGAPDNPRFYQTTLNLTNLLGAANKPLAALTFGMADVATATAIYAVSGIVAPPSPPYFVTEPTNATVVEINPATFAAVVAGNPYPAVQWYLNGGAVAGASNATLTIPTTPLTDNGALLKLVASSLVSNVTYSITSSVVTLTVIADTNPPVLIGAQSLGLNQVLVSLSKRITPASATNTANYLLTGPGGSLVISHATQDVTQSNVVLAVATMVDQASYVLTVNNLVDQTSRGNVIAPNSQAAFVASAFETLSVGNPPEAGGQVVGTNGLTITSSGSAIGGASDQFQFGWKTVSGNFDLTVRVASLGLSDTWSKAGLMARETLAPGGRFAASLATPVINGCFFEWRDPAGSASQTSGNFPDNYPNTWLRLSRVGNLFSGFASYDGQTWALLASQTITMSNQLYLGFAVDSDQTNQTVAAEFVQITNTPSSAVVGTVTYPYEPAGSCSRTTPIIISEIMWKPAPRTDTNNCEFLEIYNSNPWFQDISSYQLVCADMNYTFPPGTILAGGAYLVIAASPGSIRNVYGITNVVGPYNGSLKHSETLQLFDEHGSVLLTVPYIDTFPWPVATAATGHSLVLANPSYGEGDPRAWTISDVVGGSPGAMECFHPSPLRNVVINEVLAHSENPAIPQFVELYNHSTNTVDLSGCILTDDANVSQFVIPPGTTIGPGGFISFNASLGFTLNPAGDTIYFIKPDGSRVLDAVQFEGQANGVAFGRWPDGANDFYPLQSLTSGTNNSAIVIGNVAINELMYDPISGNDDDQYIELYNQGTNPVNLAGWQFTSGVTFTFPPSASIPPNGYVVVGKDTSELFSNYPNLNSANTYGNYSGKLSHDGERVALSMPQSLYSTSTVYVVEDEVTYGTGGRWGQWSSGGGSSLELIDPHSNHRLAANWADSDESQKSSWTEVENTGILDNGANYEYSIQHAQIGILDVGECLVDNVEADLSGTNYIANSTFESGLANWSMQGSHVQSSLENSGYKSGYSLHIRSTDKFWPAENSCQAALNANGMVAGDTVTLRYEARWIHGCPEPDLRLNGNWLEATTVLPIPRNLGTPGAPNSMYITNAGPALYSVTHSPPAPASNQPVVVTAEVHDPDGVQTLALYYRIDPATNYSSVLMKDDGTGGDAIAHDGIYSATIPGQAAQTIAAFYISAVDKLGAATRFPALLTDQSPVRECVVMFGDGNPGGSFGVYHVWLTQTNVNRWANLADLSNEGNDFTFVYDNNRVIYNALGHYSGSPFHQEFDTPAGNLCAYKWEFPDDDKFLGTTDFNKIHQPGNSPGDDPSLQREQTTWSFMRAVGVPWGYRRFVAVYVNGNRRGALMEDAQVPDSDMVKQYFPNDTGGYLYKMQPWFEFAPFPSGYAIGVTAEAYCYLMPFTTTGGVKKPARYRFNYEVRRTPDSYSDFTNVFSLVDAANSSGTPNYVANLENMANLEEWMRVFAANHAAGNLDSFGTEISQNMYGYMGVNGTKYTLMPWDLNIDLGGPQSWSPGADLLVYDPADPNLGAIYSTPAFLRMYWRAQQELVNGPLNISLTTGPLVNAKYNAFVANGLSVENPNSALLPWISAAQASIASQLAAVNASAFSINSSVTVSNNLAFVSGVAPVAVETVTINGESWPVRWLTLTNWTIAVPLRSGTNQLTVTALDINSNLIAGDSGTVSAVYTGTNISPAGHVVFNEIMYAPAAPDASFLELFNNSTNTTFNLSGWQLPELGYSFPNGSELGPRGFLTLANNQPAFAAAYGATNLVFDVFGGTLRPGQPLTLLQTNGTGSNSLTVTEVEFDSVAPWPTNANGTGSSLQLIDPRQDNWRVGNWAVAAASAAPATPGTTNSTAALLAPFQSLWLNEVEPDNLTGITNSAGQRTPWVEVYNPSTNTVSFSGLYLANNFTNLGQWPFPASAVIKPGQFLVLFADGETNLTTTNELHAGFSLAPGSGSLALTRLANSQWQVLDYLNYNGLLPNYSYGSYPDGQSFVRQAFVQPTPGGTNIGGGTPPPSFVPYLAAGSIYAQNFDSLPDPGADSVNTANPVTIDGITYSLPNPFDFAFPVSATGNTSGLGLESMAGWYGLADPLASAGVRFGATDGDQTTGGQISFGPPSSSNRALGLLATSTTGYTAFGVRLINGTPQTLNFINLQFTGEVWRQSDVPKTLTFSYLIDSTGTAGFTTNTTAFLPALNVAIPTVSADVGGAAVDGTAAANQSSLAVTNQLIVAWPPGAALWLRWEMDDATGKAQGLGIDNMSFSASTFPTGFSAPSVAATPSSGTNLTLSCASVSGLSYQVEANSSLNTTNWVPLGSPIAGTGQPLDFTLGLTNAQSYFRIRIIP